MHRAAHFRVPLREQQSKRVGHHRRGGKTRFLSGCHQGRLRAICERIAILPKRLGTQSVMVENFTRKLLKGLTFFNLVAGGQSGGGEREILEHPQCCRQ